MIDKIKKIVETIKAECPNGCSGLSCSECPLNNPDNEFGYEVCEMLAKIELLLQHKNRWQDLSARDNKHNVPHPNAVPRYSGIIEQEPIHPMDGSIIHAVQTARDNLKKEQNK